MNLVEEISAHPRSREAEATVQFERNSVSCKVDGFLHTVNNRSCSAEQTGRPGNEELGRDLAVRQIEREAMNKRCPGSPSTDEGFTHDTGNSGTSVPLRVHIVYTPFPIVSTPHVNNNVSGRDPRRYFVEKLSVILLSRFAAGTVKFPRSNIC